MREESTSSAPSCVRARAKEIQDLYPDDESGWDPLYRTKPKSLPSWQTALHHARKCRIGGDLDCIRVAYHIMAEELAGSDADGRPLRHWMPYFRGILANVAMGRIPTAEAAVSSKPPYRGADGGRARSPSAPRRADNWIASREDFSHGAPF